MMTHTCAMLKMAVACIVLLLACGSNTEKAKNSKSETNLMKQGTVKYKSDSTNELTLDFKHLTYWYDEEYAPKPGEDVGYTYNSRGKFSIQNDTLTLLSAMPSEIDTQKGWTTNTEFLPLYATHEKLKENTVKIYFDNIAEPDYYLAYELTVRGFEKLTIEEVRSLESPKYLKAEKDTLLLFKYALVTKPKSNKLLIVDKENPNNSYFFDLDKTPSSSFHFYTRAYWSYYDFTGLKFKMSSNSLQLIDEGRLNRYEHSVINKVFEKQ
ncbi:hypothetical protein ACFS7Y_22710 [Sphingobacterium bambusae]|uniref:Lipoprotein n=2 Tax=Sphingobacterium bambusae TaxID=662858 RepID=A0ABW6BL82_9SPHI